MRSRQTEELYLLADLLESNIPDSLGCFSQVQIFLRIVQLSLSGTILQCSVVQHLENILYLKNHAIFTFK